MSAAEDAAQVFYDHHYDQRQQCHVFYYEEKRFDLGVSVRMSLIYRAVKQRNQNQKRSHHNQFSGIKNCIHKDCM